MSNRLSHLVKFSFSSILFLVSAGNLKSTPARFIQLLVFVGLQGVSDVDTRGHMWTHVLSDAPLEQMLLHVSEQMFASNQRGK